MQSRGCKLHQGTRMNISAVNLENGHNAISYVQNILNDRYISGKRIGNLFLLINFFRALQNTSYGCKQGAKLPALMCPCARRKMSSIPPQFFGTAKNTVNAISTRPPILKTKNICLGGATSCPMGPSSVAKKKSAALRSLPDHENMDCGCISTTL